MRGFAALHLRRFREHRARSALSVVGIAVGSLIVVTMLGLFGSLTGSVQSIAALSGGASIQVAGSTSSGIPASLAGIVAATPRVTAVSSLVRTPVAVDGHETLLVGADLPGPHSVSGLGLAPSCLSGVRLAPNVTGVPVVLGDALARSLGVRAGDGIEVFGGSSVARATVIGVVTCHQAARLNAGSFIATTLAGAGSLTGRPDRVDAIYATAPADALPQVRDAVGGRALVSSPQLQVQLAKRSLRPLQQGLLLSISLAFVVAGFLVFNTMSMAALERRRELATLRAIGGRRRALLAGFLGEAAILGLVGSAIGSIGGILVARAAISRVPTIFLDFLGVKPSFVLPPTAVPIGIAVGTGTTLLAAYFPARKAVRVAPVDAMRPDGVLETEGGEGRTQTRLVGSGLVLLVGGTAASIYGHGSFLLVAFAATTVGVILATYGVTGVLAAGVGRLAAIGGATGRLAAAGLGRAPRRVWATMLAVAVGSAAVVAIGGVVRNQRSTFVAEFRPMARTDFWLQSTATETIPTIQRIPFVWAKRAAAIPGVQRVALDDVSFLAVGNENLELYAAQPGSNMPVFGGPGGPAVLRGEGIALTTVWAKSHGLRVGSTLSLPTPAGRQQLRVVSLVDFPVVVQGGVGMDLAHFEAWFHPTAATALEVTAKPGATSQVRAELDALAAGSPTIIHVWTGAQALAGARRSLGQSVAIFNAMVFVILGATALALLNTMAISVVQRRRELGILRAVGSSRQAVRRMIVAEAAAICIGGGTIGIVLGLVQHRIGVAATGGLTGFNVRYEFVVAPILLAAAAAMVMTLAGSAGPAWRAGQVNVIEAIGYE